MLGAKINVLGTEYTIHYKSEDEDHFLKQCDGYVDKTSKSIVIGIEPSRNELADFKTYQEKVLRHEIIHAFLYESGLHENWKHGDGHDETYVDWIAVQFPKIAKVFSGLGIL